MQQDLQQNIKLFKLDFYRVIATAGDATVQFNDGPAITILQDQPLILKSGAKPGQARIVKAVDDLQLQIINLEQILVKSVTLIHFLLETLLL